MNKENIAVLLENVAKPISRIEADLQMPVNTLQKALKGERGLPKKWKIALREYIATKKYLLEAPAQPSIKSEKPKENPTKETTISRPRNLEELKAMCLYPKGTDEYRVWVATERQKYGI